MRIILAGVGRLKRGPEAELIANYSKRLQWPLDIREVDIRGKPNAASRIEKESLGLLQSVDGADHIFALDERGKSLTSNELAGHLNKRQEAGDGTIAFVIGGADGLGETVRKRADLMLSFGSATWPHMLVRVMLVEQVYRVQTILSGHPYHRT